MIILVVLCCYSLLGIYKIIVTCFGGSHAGYSNLQALWAEGFLCDALWRDYVRTRVCGR